MRVYSSFFCVQGVFSKLALFVPGPIMHETLQQRPFCRPGFACASTQISQRFLSREKLLIVEEFLWEITRQHKMLFITVLYIKLMMEEGVYTRVQLFEELDF
jgi:hypothetical protein